VHAPEDAGLPWPPQPLNGHGNFVSRVPLDQGLGWVAGSTFERDRADLPPTPHEAAAGHAANLAKMQALAPALGQALAPVFDGARTWAAVRCTAPGRLPITGPVDAVGQDAVGQDAAGQPGLWVCTGMGARGLTLSLLCAELLAARLHAEPLPLEAKLAQALSTERLSNR
jgi:tRNA 5-methylaminomethyl-2-thiouridine biosynthesis bifunctional protein